MLPFSHCTIGILMCKIFFTISPHEEWIIIFGSLLADGIDKPLYWSKVCFATRSYGHTLLFLLFASFSSLMLENYFLGSYRITAIFFLSLCSHLLADLLFGYVPLLFPYKPFKYPYMRFTKNTKLQQRGLEIFGLLFMLFVSHLIPNCYQAFATLVSFATSL